MKVYIVYSIHRHLELIFKHNLCIYTSKEQAKEHAKLANEWNQKYHGLVASEMSLEQLTAIRNGNPYDHIHNTYSEYKIEEIDLVRHVDEYQELCH